MEFQSFLDKCEFPPESVTENENYYLDIILNKQASGNAKTAYVYGKEWINVIENKAQVTAFDKYILALLYYCEKDFDKSLSLLQESVLQVQPEYGSCDILPE